MHLPMQNYNTFTLFECRRYMAPKATSTTTEIPQDEHVLLDDNKYIEDILCEFKNAKSSKV